MFKFVWWHNNYNILHKAINILSYYLDYYSIHLHIPLPVQCNLCIISLVNWAFLRIILAIIRLCTDTQYRFQHCLTLSSIKIPFMGFKVLSINPHLRLSLVNFKASVIQQTHYNWNFLKDFTSPTILQTFAIGESC